jgi:hypothetical protein
MGALGVDLHQKDTIEVGNKSFDGSTIPEIVYILCGRSSFLCTAHNTSTIVSNWPETIVSVVGREPIPEPYHITQH